MPKLWNETIEAHRQEVRDAVIGATVDLVASEGLRSVTMTQIADAAGIGRATLYKYFSDVEAILREWHQGRIESHLAEIDDARSREVEPVAQLRAVLATYASNMVGARGHSDSDLVSLLHGDQRVATAEQRLTQIVRDTITAAAKAGDVRRDVPPAELAVYCLHALSAARELRTKPATARLVDVILDALRPDASSR